MHLSDHQVNRLIDNLSQINKDCEQVLKEGLDSPSAKSLFVHYKELKTFLNKLEVSNLELKERINQLPSLQEPDFLIGKVIFLNTVLIGLSNPYLLIILSTFTAPVTVPLIIVWKIWINKQKQKVRGIAVIVSSIKFIIEHPSYFTVESKNNF